MEQVQTEIHLIEDQCKGCDTAWVCLERFWRIKEINARGVRPPKVVDTECIMCSFCTAVCQTLRFLLKRKQLEKWRRARMQKKLLSGPHFLNGDLACAEVPSCWMRILRGLSDHSATESQRLVSKNAWTRQNIRSNGRWNRFDGSVIGASYSDWKQWQQPPDLLQSNAGKHRSRSDDRSSLRIVMYARRPRLDNTMPASRM